MPLEPALLLTLVLLGTPDGPAADAPGDASPPEVMMTIVNGRVLRIDRPPAPDRTADGGGDGVVEQPAGFARPASPVWLARENFDEIVFPNAPLPRDRRPHLHFVLDYWIGKVAERRSLTESERHQLRLAGSGDIQRYFDRVEAARGDFEATRSNFKAGVAQLDRLDALGREFRQGPFGDGSMYAKVLARIEKDRG